MIAAERGLSSGTPIFFLHGTDIDHRSLLPLDAAFKEDEAQQWRRLYVNLPGASGAPTEGINSTETVVDYVEQVIREQLGDEAQFALVGHSFGGMLVRALAHRPGLRERVLGICLVCPVLVSVRELRQVPKHLCLHEDSQVVKDVFAGDEAMASEYRAMAVMQASSNAQLFRDSVFPGLRESKANVWAKISANYNLAIEPEKQFADRPFNKPSLFLLGRQDAVTGYRDAWTPIEHYPRAMMAILDEAGHSAHLDKNALVVALLLDWLQRMQAR